MGIFQRLGTLIKSNLNELISRAEDPEKMLNQIVLDMQNQLVQAKRQVAVAIADEKRLKKQWEEHLELGREWERKAMLAVRAGDDDLARQALLRRQELSGLAGQYDQQWQQQRQAVDALKQQLGVLSGKIEEAKRKKNILIARQKRAEAQKAIQATMQGLQETSAFETFERMASRVEQIEAEAEAVTELGAQVSGDTLAQRFQQLESGKGADALLEEFKSKMALEAGPGAAPALPPSGGGAERETAAPSAVDAELARLKEQLGRGEGGAGS